MFMRVIGFILLATLTMISISATALADQTIYLIRHAEKVKDGSEDPALTDLGKARAESFAKYFKDNGLKAVFSSDNIRTFDTAEPTANANGFFVMLYDAENLDEIAKIVRDARKTALIVGHSNTTAVLANILTGGDLPNLEDHHYDRIYIITLKDNGAGTVQIDHIEPYTP